MDNEGLRDAIKKYSPPWLSDGTAEKYLYAIGLTLDGFLEGANEGVKARMPGVGDPSALKYIGADRVLDRGASETDASYATRLRHAIHTWHTAGTAGAVLRELAVALAPHLIRTVSNTAAWDTIDPSGAPDANGDIIVDHYLSPTNNFDWDGDSTSRWRAWVIIYSDLGQPWSSSGTFGGGSVFGDGSLIGLSGTASLIASVRALVAKWKPAHAAIPWIIVVLNDDALFDPLGASTPDGTWGAWSHQVAGVQVPARANDCRFIDGVDRGF